MFIPESRVFVPRFFILEVTTMGIIRILLFLYLITGTLAFGHWHSQSESSDGIDWDSLQDKTDEETKEELCRHGHPYCFMTYAGAMFTTQIWPCGRECP